MKIISTKWLDVNKGDSVNPNYRARLVGREIARDKRDDLFAATPPLESLRVVISKCASNQNSRDPAENFIMMSNDVKRAYFYAPTTRPIYINIPDEDKEPGDENMVGRLNLSLYGTRDAAKNWAKKFTEVMESAGFVRGAANPCNFHHPAKEVSVTVHGDDFTSTGRERDLRWLQKHLEANFEIKTDFLGPDLERHSQEIRILNRVISWQADCITYEADQRHAEIIIKELNLENSKPVTTPGAREDTTRASVLKIDEGGQVTNDEEVDVGGELLGKAEATQSRALAARGNFMA